MTIKGQDEADPVKTAINRLEAAGCTRVECWETPYGNLSMRIEHALIPNRVRVAMPKTFDSLEAAVNSLTEELLDEIKEKGGSIA